MCGRYTLIETNRLTERFKTINTLEELQPNYNVAPGHIMPVVIDQDGKSVLKLMKWGLVPSWAKEPRVGYKMINARAEGIETKPSFRHSYKKQRCIVPANGFYEWQKRDEGKTPKYIGLKGYPLIGLAGLWEHWQQPDGTPLETYTIITTSPNKLMEPIHDRMPVILKQELEDDWLNHKNDDPEFLRTLLTPYTPDNMVEQTVSDRVNSVKNNHENLTLPA